VRINLRALDLDVAKVTERLSTGLKLPSDSTGALAVGAIFDSAVRGLQAAGANLQQGISLIDVADESLSQIADLISGLKPLATQAADGTLTDAQRAPLNAQFVAAKTSIDAIVTAARFNGFQLLDGTGGTITLQAGPSSTDTFAIPLTVDFSTTTTLTALAALTIDTQANAQTALAAAGIPAAESAFGTARATFTGRSATISARAAAAGEQQIAAISARRSFREIDVAEETSRLVRDQLLQTSGAAALQVANFSGAGIVNLLSAVAARAAAV
jgi:flagellin